MHFSHYMFRPRLAAIFRWFASTKTISKVVTIYSTDTVLSTEVIPIFNRYTRNRTHNPIINLRLFAMSLQSKNDCNSGPPDQIRLLTLFKIYSMSLSSPLHCDTSSAVLYTASYHSGHNASDNRPWSWVQASSHKNTGHTPYLTPTRWSLLDRTPVAQLLVDFPTVYGTLGFITVFTRAFLSWARSIQSKHPIL
jgi:hypothetical protein